MSEDKADGIVHACARAYGILWRDIAGTPYGVEAMRILGNVLSRAEKEAGINAAIAQYGPIQDAEVEAAALWGDLP